MLVFSGVVDGLPLAFHMSARIIRRLPGSEPFEGSLTLPRDAEYGEHGASNVIRKTTNAEPR